jgi:PilZ domain-containing protein
MNSIPQILARLTLSGMVIVSLLMLWLVVRPSAAETANGGQRRGSTRHLLLLPVNVDGRKGVKGITNNLSLGGCRINGNLAVRRGQHLTVRLHLPGEESPLVVERAAVRWVDGEDFGLQFLSLPSGERERLQGLLQWVA